MNTLALEAYQNESLLFVIKAFTQPFHQSSNTSSSQVMNHLPTQKRARESGEACLVQSTDTPYHSEHVLLNTTRAGKCDSPTHVR